MSVARCHRTMATAQRGTNWGGSLLIGLVATGAGMQRKPACWRWMAEPRLQRSLSAPRHTIWPFFFFFGRSCKDRDIHAHGLSADQTDVLCFCMLLPSSAKTTLQHRHQEKKSVHLKRWRLSTIIINWWIFLVWNKGVTAVRPKYFKFNSFSVTARIKQATIVVS